MDSCFSHSKLYIFLCICFNSVVGVSPSEDKTGGLHSAWHRPVPQITTKKSRDTTAKEKRSRTRLLLPVCEGHAQGHLQSQGLQVKYCHLLMVPAESRAGGSDVGTFPSMALKQDVDKPCLGPWAVQDCAPCWRNSSRCVRSHFCLFPAVTFALKPCLKMSTWMSLSLRHSSF